MKEVNFQQAGNGMIDKLCPFQIPLGESCGNWCPHFEYREQLNTARKSVIVITCSGMEVMLGVKE